MKKRRGPILILIGLVLIIAAVGLVLYNNWDSDRAGRESEEIADLLESIIIYDPAPVPTMDNGQPVALPDPQATPQPIEAVEPGEEETVPGETDADTPPMATVWIEEWRYIGVLELPTLNLKLPVLNRWSYAKLNVAPCRYYGSVYRNNMVICGHNYATHFSPVRSIALGADVYFTDVTGTRFHYVVSGTETVQPMAVEDMIISDGEWDLTLFTCNIGGATRFACRCKLVEVIEPENPTGEADYSD